MDDTGHACGHTIGTHDYETGRCAAVTCSCRGYSLTCILGRHEPSDSDFGIGIGPHVKCAATCPTDGLDDFMRAWIVIYPNYRSCVRSPADGHTLHETADARVRWEGLP